MTAMQSEYDALIENVTWTLCDLPPGKKAIGTKWVYKLERKPDGEIDRYKDQLVAKGYAQQKGIDYEETFAPTCRMTTVRFLCALAAYFGWDVHQSDIVTTFLNGDIFEEVYVTQPCNFVKKGQEDKLCKCHKALHGLNDISTPQGNITLKIANAQEWMNKVKTDLEDKVETFTQALVNKVLVSHLEDLEFRDDDEDEEKDEDKEDLAGTSSH
ncbi:hypothetical protein L7F22_020667 [Adiantum nelumboides]|nr:hypothetical protein [Adiantum nelumboides]